MITLKHLAPYLPYGLKIYWEQLDGTPNKPWTLTINSIEFALENQNKPILRPLSDLNQDGEINTPESLQGCCYSYVQNLISQHYDVFGLIPQGLAIDVNTLTK